MRWQLGGRSLHDLSIRQIIISGPNERETGLAFKMDRRAGHKAAYRPRAVFKRFRNWADNRIASWILS